MPNMDKKDYTLIIAHDREAIHLDTPLILLGKWCDIDNFSDECKGEVIFANNPLADNNEREKHYYKIQKISERLLSRMGKRLNTYHKVSFPNKVWKMLLGNYVLMFSHLTYVKWLLLQNAFKINNTKVVRVPMFDYQDDFYPKNYKHFSCLLNSENFYEYLTKEIILKMDFNVNIEEFKKNHFTQEYYSVNIPSFKKRLYEKIIVAGKWIYKSGINPKILFFNSSLPTDVELKYNLQLGQIPFIHPFEDLKIKETRDHELRTKLKSNNYSGFEKILYELLWDFTPISYLESFSSNYNQISEQTKKFNPNTIVTSMVGIMESEPFLLYLASKGENKPTVISLQHGGRYGTAKYNNVEEHEIEVSDYFFSWGWKTKNNVIPSYMHKQLGSKKKNAKSGSYLIFLPYGTHLHPKRIACSIWLTGMEKFIDDQKIFFNNIEPKIKTKLRIRSLVHAWQSKKRLSDHVSDFHESKKTYMQDLNRAKIAVHTCCSTTLLETLAFDIPTIAFFDKDSDRISDHASKYFEMLTDVKILHYDPLSAANHINSVWDDVEEWWYSEEVKKAKRNFVKEFANLNENSEDEFFSQLIRIYKANESKN